MKAVYKSILTEMDDAFATAALQNKQIARFELSEIEYHELKALMWLPYHSGAECHAYRGIPIVRVK